LKGPDDKGHGRNWTIGNPAKGETAGKLEPRIRYKIRAPLDERGDLVLVAWELEQSISNLVAALDDNDPDLGTEMIGGDATDKHLFITGTGYDWRPYPLTWDADDNQYFCRALVGKNGWESFQLLWGGDWDAAVYPSVADAGPRVPHDIRDPDKRGWKELDYWKRARSEVVQAGDWETLYDQGVIR